jgi:hemin uptake protein HemP
MDNNPVRRMEPNISPQRLTHTPQKVQSEALLGDAKELLIVHNGREYRLRLTQSGKLILTA